ncbi:MAG: hypothetical protein ACXACD_22545, partial [Candidatus Thorarchaeota archaeon]|jgi:hypothetical protein
MTLEHLKLIEANMDKDSKEFINTAFDLQKTEMVIVWFRGYIEGFLVHGTLDDAPEWLKAAVAMMKAEMTKG